MKYPVLNSKSKITIVGTSGAGKSTLANKLAVKLNLTDIELDAIFWKPNWTQTPEAEFREKILEKLQESEGWVMHGNYSKVRDLTWGKASVVIWLDYSKRVVFWRVFKRSVLRILSREPLWSGNRETLKKTFLSKQSILLWSYQTYDLRKSQYEYLAKYPDFAHIEKIIFKHPAEAEAFLNSI